MIAAITDLKPHHQASKRANSLCQGRALPLSAQHSLLLSFVFVALTASCANEAEPIADTGARVDARADTGGARADVVAMDGAAVDQDADIEPDIDGGTPPQDVPDFDSPNSAMDVPNAMMDVPNGRADARVADSGRPVVRTIGYRMATYTQRGNWVLDCTRGYAYTARGGDHIAEDCDRAYAPDGTYHGTATFLFRAVVASNYDVEIVSRFSMNRDPGGALFTINGRAFPPIDQRPGSTIVTTTLTRIMLSGDVSVVLDNSRGSGSDSVQSVTLRPAP